MADASSGRAGKAQRPRIRKHGVERNRHTRAAAVTASHARQIAEEIEKAGGSLAVLQQIHHNGLRTAARLSRMLAEWALHVKPDSLDADQKLSLMTILPKFIQAQDRIGELIADRVHAHAARSVPLEPGSVPLVPASVSVSVQSVALDGEPVAVDGEVLPPDPMDEPFIHPDLDRISEADRRAEERLAAERRARRVRLLQQGRKP